MAVVGYRYKFGIHMGIGRGPVDQLSEIRVGDKRAWMGSVIANGTVNIDAPELFGGDAKEGGIQGTLEVMMGEPTQTASAGLLAMLGAPLPGFRRMFTCFYKGLISSNNPYPKPWKFRFHRTRKGWDGDVFMPELAEIRIAAEEPSDVEQEAAPTGHIGVDPPVGWVNVPNTTFDDVAWASHGATSISMRPAAFFGATRGWWGPSPLTGAIDTSGEEPAGWTPSFPEKFGALYFPNATPPGYYAPSDVYNSAGAPIDTSGDPPSGWVATYPGDPYGFYFSNWQGSFQGPWWKPSTTFGSIVPEGWVETDENDQYWVFFPGWGYWKPADAGAPTGDPELTEVIHAMNPAHIIYECLTNREWGRGLPRTMLDQTSFERAAIQLYAEGFGLCMKWLRKDEIKSFVQSVLDHISATMFLSRKTGLVTLRLIRGDYDFSALPVFNGDTGLVEIREAASASAGLSLNQIEVTYHNPLNDLDRTVKLSNQAAVIAARNTVNSSSVSYPGIPVPSLALRVAQRDLRIASTSLRRFSLVFDRRGVSIEPGSVIVIEDASRNIPRMAVRIGRVEAGTLTDGKMTAAAVQDAFSLPAKAFAANVPPTFTPPTSKPCIDEQETIEVPYFVLAGTMRPADFAYVSENGGYVALLNSVGGPLNVGARMAVRDGAPTLDDEPVDGSYTC